MMYQLIESNGKEIKKVLSEDKVVWGLNNKFSGINYINNNSRNNNSFPTTKSLGNGQYYLLIEADQTESVHVLVEKRGNWGNNDLLHDFHAQTNSEKLFRLNSLHKFDQLTIRNLSRNNKIKQIILSKKRKYSDKRS